ncbi:hypothetical protein, partial [Salmonella enterica]|uniref:hypothetical protein n=1 Tax=Salmonella enterica TaxID=28901 RepID=UPI003CC90A84
MKQGFKIFLLVPIFISGGKIKKVIISPCNYIPGKLLQLRGNYEATWFYTSGGTVAKLAMRQPFVLFKGLTFQKLCLPGAFRPGDHHNKMLRPG